MKALLLLSVLMLSTGTAKAEEMDPKEAYFSGVVAGAGMMLCVTLVEGNIDNKFAQEALGFLVKQLSSAPDSSDVANSIQKAYQAVKQGSTCKGAF